MTNVVETAMRTRKPAGAVAARAAHDPETVYLHYHRLVRQIARRVFMTVSSALPLEDLVQIGAIALLEASSRYDPAGGGSFSSYASLRIRGAMLDELRRYATTSRASRVQRRAFNAAREALGEELGAAPTDSAVAGRLGISVERLRSNEAKAQPAFLCSLDSVYSESNLAFADGATGALGSLLEEEERDLIATEIAKLPKRHALVLQLFFHEQLTLAEIGAVLGVCPARVCQIKRKALERIRRGLEA